MTAKWLDRGSILRALALTALVTGVAQAQLVDGQYRAAPQPQRRVAVQVHAPTVFAQQQFANPVLAPRQPVQFAFVPTIVMSDGTVYSNYGYGYQQVVSCAPAPFAPTAFGNGMVPASSSPVQPTVTQPVPNQPTRTQQTVSPNRSLGGQFAQPCAQSVAPTPAPVARRY